MNLHEYLVSLKDPETLTCVGICNNGSKIKLYSPEYNQMKELMLSWPKFSGNETYPIPHPDQGDWWSEGHKKEMAQFAYDSYPRWTGEYGELRIELLDYLIEQTKPSGE